MTISPPTVSIVTAVGPGNQPYLGETEESVMELARHARHFRVDVEWVVGFDGGATALTPRRVDREVRLSEHAGVAATRNAALAQATGDWVVPLDADDTIDPFDLVPALVALHDNGWEWAGMNRVLANCSRTPHWFDNERHFKAGELAQEWTAPFPFHPNSMVIRTGLLLEVGGWPAVPANEDLAMALLVSEAADGGMVPNLLTYYRVWEGQQVARPGYPEDKSAAFTVIERFVNARRAAAGRLPVARPVNPGGAHGIQRL